MSDASAVVVRALRATDEARVVETLALAFDRDPITRFSLREDDKRPAALRSVFRTFYRLYAPLGLSCVAAEGAGVTLWTRHDDWQPPLLQELLLAPVYLEACGLSRVLRGLRGVNAMKAHHPRSPHYYLFAIGVDPVQQRRGLAAALLRHTLSICDRERMPAYLEATSPHNRALYLRHGFAVVEELEFGRGGPLLTAMLRQPA